MSKRFLLSSWPKFLCQICGLCCLLLFCAAGSGEEAQKRAREYDPKGKRDPFVALVRDGRLVGVTGEQASSAGFSTLLLEGIVWDPQGGSFALINGTEVRVGDNVGDYQVSQIHKDAVVLVRDGQSLTLQITFGETNKTKAGP